MAQLAASLLPLAPVGNRAFKADDTSSCVKSGRFCFQILDCTSSLFIRLGTSYTITVGFFVTGKDTENPASLSLLFPVNADKSLCSVSTAMPPGEDVSNRPNADLRLRQFHNGEDSPLSSIAVLLLALWRKNAHHIGWWTYRVWSNPDVGHYVRHRLRK